MGGGLMQLLAYGTQDQYLTGNPQITYFKAVFRRHTNFSIESQKLIFSGTTKFGGSSTCTIYKNADLMYKVYLQVQLPSIKLTVNNSYKSFRWLNWIGHKIIKKYSLKLGGSTIDGDGYDGEWLHILNELSQKEGKKEGYAEMVGNVPRLTQIHSIKDDTGTDRKETILDKYMLYIPLHFWFCKNPGLALPLNSLSETNIEIIVDFEEFNNLIWGTEENNSKIRVNRGEDIFESIPSLDIANIYVDYIYLDSDEKRRFTENAHQYLIEQVQQKGVSNYSPGSSTINFDLNFTHPVKEIIWRIQPSDFTNPEYCQSRAGMQWFNYTDQFDYSGFTGTPEPEFGPGMIGGRSAQNLWYGLPSVRLPYEKNLFEPNFNSDDVTDNSETNGLHWLKNQDLSLTKTITDSTTDSHKNKLKRSGYDFVSKYFYNNSTTNENIYNNKNIENFIGNTSAIQNDNNNVSLGAWSNPSSDMRLTDYGKNPSTHATIELNGIKRFDERESFYFNVIQPYQHHTNIPSVGINVYSFSLDPEDHQPSGTCNFSKIDNSNISVKLTTKAQNRNIEMKVYAVNYNILRIQKGRADLSFSN